MTRDYYPPDPPLTAEERSRVALLSPEQLQAVDAALMANISDQWRKVARVVMSAMSDLDEEGKRVIGIPDIFYVERIREFMKAGHIEGDGDFTRAGRSEIRLPPTALIEQ